jgi:hypothetical protein
MTNSKIALMYYGPKGKDFWKPHVFAAMYGKLNSLFLVQQIIQSGPPTKGIFVPQK